MNNIDKRIEIINQKVLEGAKQKDLGKIKEGISDLRDILQSLKEWVSNIFSEEDIKNLEQEDPFAVQIVNYIQQVNEIIHNFLSFIEQENFSEKDIEELKNLEMEIEQVTEIIEEIMDESIEDYSDTDLDEAMNILEGYIPEELGELEELEESQQSEQSDLLFDDQDEEDEYLNQLLDNINEALEKDDEQKIAEELDKLNKYIKEQEQE